MIDNYISMATFSEVHDRQLFQYGNFKLSISSTTILVWHFLVKYMIGNYFSMTTLS